jgi:predicted metal-dependent hydrolase
MTEPAASRRERRLVYKTITVPGNLQIACDQMNSGQYFECHETFEEIWQEEHGPVRDVYKGLIQVAAAFVHVRRNNHFGANRLLTTALGYLKPYRESGAMGLDIERICWEAEAALAAIDALGKGHVDELDLSLAPRYAFDRSILASEALRWSAWGFDREGKALEVEIPVIE